MADIGALKQELRGLVNTQLSIQGASKSMLDLIKQAPAVAALWKSEFDHNVNKRLELLYVANDVMQTSKRTHGEMFTAPFATVLGGALAAFVSTRPNDRRKIDKLVQLWTDRKILNVDQLDQVNQAMVSGNKSAHQQHQERQRNRKQHQHQHHSHGSEKNLHQQHAKPTHHKRKKNLVQEALENPIAIDIDLIADSNSVAGGGGGGQGSAGGGTGDMGMGTDGVGLSEAGRLACRQMNDLESTHIINDLLAEKAADILDTLEKFCLATDGNNDEYSAERSKDKAKSARLQRQGSQGALLEDDTIRDDEERDFELEAQKEQVRVPVRESVVMLADRRQKLTEENAKRKEVEEALAELIEETIDSVAEAEEGMSVVERRAAELVEARERVKKILKIVHARNKKLSPAARAVARSSKAAKRARVEESPVVVKTNTPTIKQAQPGRVGAGSASAAGGGLGGAEAAMTFLNELGTTFASSATTSVGAPIAATTTAAVAPRVPAPPSHPPLPPTPPSMPPMPPTPQESPPLEQQQQQQQQIHNYPMGTPSVSAPAADLHPGFLPVAPPRGFPPAALPTGFPPSMSPSTSGSMYGGGRGTGTGLGGEDPSSYMASTPNKVAYSAGYTTTPTTTATPVAAPHWPPVPQQQQQQQPDGQQTTLSLLEEAHLMNDSMPPASYDAQPPFAQPPVMPPVQPSFTDQYSATQQHQYQQQQLQYQPQQYQQQQQHYQQHQPHQQYQHQQQQQQYAQYQQYGYNNNNNNSNQYVPPQTPHQYPDTGHPSH